eukprot:jgi/Hompol1/5731/HPOL_004676-RA
MTREQAVYDAVVALLLGASPAVWLLLSLIVAPFGKFTRRGFGPLVAGRWGWLVFESVPLVSFVSAAIAPSSSNSYSQSQLQSSPSVLQMLLFAMFTLHYINRGIIYPLRAPAMASMPISIVLSGICFNIPNGYANGRFIGLFGAEKLAIASTNLSSHPNVFIGLAMFIFGMYVNITSDETLFSMRKELVQMQKEGRSSQQIRSKMQVDPTGRYVLPVGGWFGLVSCPHYFGEIVEWLGFAITGWSLPGLAFAIFTAANLIPRAIHQHRWYLDTFGSQYPKERRAVIPWLV